MTRERSLKARQSADAWNAENPVGTSVRYWTGLREGEGVHANTRTEASVLGGHTAVVWVDGEGAFIALTHVERVDGEPSDRDAWDGVTYA